MIEKRQKSNLAEPGDRVRVWFNSTSQVEGVVVYVMHDGRGPNAMVDFRLEGIEETDPPIRMTFRRDEMEIISR